MFLVFVTIGVCRARVLFTIYIGVFVSASVEFWKKTSKTAHAVPWRCKVSALYLDSSSTINPRNNTYLSCLACDHACACNRGAYLRLISRKRWKRPVFPLNISRISTYVRKKGILIVSQKLFQRA